MSMQYATERARDLPFMTGKQEFPHYNPQELLFPVEEGNDQRPFHAQNYHEMIAGMKVLMQERLVMKTIIDNLSVLTYAWPKVKLVEGKRVLEYREREYYPTPFTNVPQRGVVRFMSQSARQYRIAISQKGIGEDFHGSVLRSPEGPRVVDEALAAMSEGLNITMGLNTATNMVNAAFENSMYNRSRGSTFALSYATKMSRDIDVYASMGEDAGQLTTLTGNVLREYPDFDTVLVPDGSDNQLGDNAMSVSLNVPIYAYKDGSAPGVRGTYIEFESENTITTLGQMKSGRVSIFEMPVFRLYARNTTFQALESEVTVGEVYVDENVRESGFTGDSEYSPKMENIYIYDQPGDKMAKIGFRTAVDHSFIWDPQNDSYHPHLVKYVENLNSKAGPRGHDDDGPAPGVPLQYPIARENGSDRSRPGARYYLPEHIGNLSSEHLPDDVMFDIVETAVSALTVGPQNRNLFADATNDMEMLERLRQSLEAYEYSAADLEKIARANIDRSVVNSGDGVKFVGELTPADRLSGREGQIVEWKPNEHGGLNVPADAKAIGFFSAAGIRTLAHTNGHELQRLAEISLSFLEKMAGRFAAIFRRNPLNNHHIIPPQFHRVDNIQNILDAMYGHRAPLFLAAPEALVGQPAGSAPVSEAKSGGMTVRTTGNPDDGLVFEKGDRTLFQSPEGIIVGVDSETLAAWPHANDGKAKTDVIVRELPAWVPKYEFGANPDEQRIRASRSLVQKILDTNSRDNRIKLANAYLGIGKLQENEQKNQLELLFLNPIPTKKKDKAIWLTTFNETSEKGKSDEAAEDIVSAIENALFKAEDIYQKLGGSQKESVNQSSAQYAEFVELVTRIVNNNPNIDRARSYYYTTEEIQIDGAVNLATQESLEQREKDMLEGYSKKLALGIRVQKQRGARDASVLDVAHARYYRAPLSASWNVVKDLQRVDFPWVLPADPRRQFLEPVKPDEFSESGLFDRFTFLHNSQPGIDLVMRASDRAEEEDFWFEHLDVVLPNFRGGAGGSSLRGPIHHRLAMVREQYASNAVKRLLGFGVLMTPHHILGALKSLVSHGVMPPFSLAHWRLQSKGLFGDILVMKKGIESGANVWNHADILPAVDNVTNYIQLRATIDTDAAPLRPENHFLVGPAQPRGYIGGHNSALVRDVRDLMQGSEQIRPAVISTVVPRNHMETRLFPISFVNEVPAVVDRQTRDPLPASPEHQYWSGADYYGRHVYASFFNQDELMRYDATNADVLVFDEHSMRRNHLAFRGYHFRYDPVMGYFAREISGNGHRANPRFNLPGARKYFSTPGATLRTIKMPGDLRLT